MRLLRFLRNATYELVGYKKQFVELRNYWTAPCELASKILCQSKDVIENDSE